MLPKYKVPIRSAVGLAIGVGKGDIVRDSRKKELARYLVKEGVSKDKIKKIMNLGELDSFYLANEGLKGVGASNGLIPGVVSGIIARKAEKKYLRHLGVSKHDAEELSNSHSSPLKNGIAGGFSGYLSHKLLG